MLTTFFLILNLIILPTSCKDQSGLFIIKGFIAILALIKNGIEMQWVWSLLLFFDVWIFSSDTDTKTFVLISEGDGAEYQSTALGIYDQVKFK